MKHVLFTLAALIGILSSGAVFAEGADDLVVCAAIHPCNPDGSVMEQFNTPDACGLRYAKECLSEKANEAVSLCEDNSAAMRSQIAELESKLSAAKKKIRRLRQGR